MSSPPANRQMPAAGPRAPAARGGSSGPSFVLASVMHGLLFGGMWLAVQWKTAPEAPAVAELWGALPAITAVPLEPLPAPVPAPAPPPPPPPPPPEERPADIVEKQEKAPPPKPEKKLEDPKKVEPKKDELKAEADKLRRDNEKRDKEKREKEAEKRIQDELTRIAGQVERPSAAANTGGRPGGADGGYAALLSGLIKPRIAFAVPDGTPADVHADFIVDLLPSGEIAQVRVVNPSGLPGYDAAVERAIRRTDPFPKRKDGTVPTSLTLVFRPVER